MPRSKRHRFARAGIPPVLLLGMAHATFAPAAPVTPLEAPPCAPAITVDPGVHAAYAFGAMTGVPSGVHVTSPCDDGPPQVRCEGVPRYFDHGAVVPIRVIATGRSGLETVQEIPVTLYRPNLLSINIDDLNDWVSFLDVWPGNPLTPKLQRLADRSVVFTRAYCASPLCTPSRASIITGRHPSDTGIYFDGEWYRAAAANPAVRNREAIVPYLRDQGGYVTYGAGKFAHDGNDNLQYWTEWLFGDPMSSVQPEHDDHYFRRPPEPRMPEENRLLASNNQGVTLVWGVSRIAVDPVEIVLAPNAADAANATTAPLHGTYTITVHNLSSIYRNGWKICRVSPDNPEALLDLPVAGDPSANVWVDCDRGMLAPDDITRLDDRGSSANIQVYVRRPEAFTLAIVPDPAIDANQTEPRFCPAYIRFVGTGLSWSGPPLQVGDTQRTLQLANYLDTPQSIVLPAWARGGEDVSFTLAPGVKEFQVTLAPGERRDVVVRWSARRWLDFNAPVPPPKGGNGMEGKMSFSLGAYDANDYRRLGTISNTFKEEPRPAGQGLEISDSLIATRVIDWLNAQADCMAEAGPEAPPPFFLSAGIYHPHLPLYAPKEYYDRAHAAGYPTYFDPANIQPDGSGLPPWGKFLAMRAWLFQPLQDLELVDDFAEAYKASIALADMQVGRILDAVEANPALRDSTVILLWSDNGFHLGEQQHLWKSALWERTAHVPLMIHVPGMQSCARANTPVSLHDLYPTLLELAGVRYPRFLYEQRGLGTPGTPAKASPTRAVSLVPLLADVSKRRMEYDTISAGQLAAWFPGIPASDGLQPATMPLPVITSFARPPMGAQGAGSPVSDAVQPEGRNDIPIAAARDEQYRYIRYTLPGAASEMGNELYDITDDPWERQNLLPAMRVPALLQKALHFEGAAPLPPYAAASTGSYVTGARGPQSFATNVIVTESCSLTSAGDIVAVDFVLHTANLSPVNQLHRVSGTFYFDGSRFAFAGAELPATGLPGAWTASTQPLPQLPDENTPRQPGDTMQAINFRVSTDQFAFGLTESTPRSMLRVRLRRLTLPDTGADTLWVVSNRNTRILPELAAVDPVSAP